jgi:phosphate transport system substrate-binding protein
MVKEFMTMILSKEGQSIVEKDGYVALPSTVANKELAKLQ